MADVELLISKKEELASAIKQCNDGADGSGVHGLSDCGWKPRSVEL
jgi:hypothetical protein